MDGFKIEHGITPPPPHGRGYTEVLRKLKKGDSVVLPIGRQNASSAAMYALGSGNYVCRSLGNGKKGCRVWRLK